MAWMWKTAALLFVGLMLAAPASASPVPGPDDLAVPDAPIHDGLGTGFSTLTASAEAAEADAKGAAAEGDAVAADLTQEAEDATNDIAAQANAAANEVVGEGTWIGGMLGREAFRATAEMRRGLERQVDDVQAEATTLLPVDDEPATDGNDARPQGDAVIESGDTRIIVGTAMVAATGLAVAWLVKSGVIGIGATMTGGSAAAGTGAGASRLMDLRKVPGVAAPMFTRFTHDTVMDNPRRKELFDMVAANPGICLPDLCEQSGLSRTAATHHLRLLEKQHVLVSERRGRSRHYFQNGGRYASDQKEAYAVLQNERSHALAGYISSTPGTIQKDLCEALGMDASVAHWHLKRLQDAGLVNGLRDGRTVAYYPAAPLQDIRRAAQLT